MIICYTNVDSSSCPVRQLAPSSTTTELLPVGTPTDLDVSETANVIVDNDMALFTDVVKRGKKKAQKTKARIAPPAVAVVRKTGKSSAITGRGVGVGIEATKRSGRLASVFASRLIIVIDCLRDHQWYHY